MGRLADGGIVGAPLPIRHGLTLSDSFPPRLIVRGHTDIGKYGVMIEHRQGIWVGVWAGTRRHAKKTGFRANGPQAPVFARTHPAYIVANRPDFPARVAFRWNQHGQVGLAAG